MPPLQLPWTSACPGVDSHLSCREAGGLSGQEKVLLQLQKDGWVRGAAWLDSDYALNHSQFIGLTDMSAPHSPAATIASLSLSLSPSLSTPLSSMHLHFHPLNLHSKVVSGPVQQLLRKNIIIEVMTIKIQFPILNP